MRILWIHRDSTNGQGGDAIYDRKMVSALKQHAEVVTLSCRRNDRRTRLLAMLRRRIPPDRAGFGTDGDIKAILTALSRSRFDSVVVSHEHLDYLPGLLRKLGAQAVPPTYLVVHNVASTSYREIFGGLFGRALGRTFEAYERRVFSNATNVTGIFCLSLRDQETVRALGKRFGTVHLAMPGCPPTTPLHEGARLMPELMLLGSYDWFPKRWSLQAFVTEWQTTHQPRRRLFADEEVAESVRAALQARSSRGLSFTDAIRFGLITDRFTAGHKLKTASYLMQNCVVLSYAEVVDDFAFSQWSTFFIRRIRHLDDLSAIEREFAAIEPATLCERMQLFKQEIATHLSWQGQAHALFHVLRLCVTPT